MKKERIYQIAIGFLLLVIILQCVIFLGKPKKAPKLIPVQVSKIKGRIAIVIDDWGYNENNLPLAQEINHRITASVLPNLPFSRKVSEKLHAHGFEIILHLPMEPKESVRLENNTITTSMDADQISRIVSDDLASLSYAVGVSNHMGSKATGDARTMELIFKELKKKNLYFLDSFVVADSVCPDLAKSLHLGFTRRDIFLDNTESPEYIRGQLDKLKNKALLYGRAVGIGHDRRKTLEVLKQVLPEYEKEGYKFVFVSELLSHQ